MTTPDHLYRFLFDQANVRGEIVHLDDAYQSVITRRAYPPVMRDLIGRALAAAALLSSSIKFRGSLSLQVQGRGEEGLTLLVVQVNTQGGLRALARWRGELPEEATLGELCPDGYLAITIDPDEGDRYQGIVALEGDSLARALDNYFQNSEQLPTRVWLVADEQRAAGMLIQRLPSPTGDEDAWNRAEMLAETITDDELLKLNAPAIIRRLYHEEDIRLFDPVPFHFQCTCSRERVGEVLRSLGQDEMQDIIEEQGQVEVHCDFCNEGYRYDPVDIEQLFVPDGNAPEVPTTRH
jgi:molecular chaperone Hsp33